MQRLRTLASAFAGLRLLVLHGSRVRGDAHQRSDWDFAWTGNEQLDVLELRRQLAEALHTDCLDLADLAQASGLLRFRIARDGVALFESSPGAFEEFCLEAARFWFDVAGIVRAEQAELLRELD